MADSDVYLWGATTGGPRVATDKDSSTGVHRPKIITQGVPGIDIADGSVTGTSGVVKFGRNAAVGATEEDIWAAGGIYTGFLTAASAVRIRAGGNAADDAAGAGARSIEVEGLDQNWNVVTETISTAGASASTATTTTFIRVYRVCVIDVGTYTGANTGTISVETTGGVLMATIEAGLGQTQMAIYTVPAGKTAYIVSLSIFVDTNKTAQVYLWQRQNADDVSAPFTGKRIWRPFDGVSGAVDGPVAFPYVFPAKTDIWASGVGPSGGAGVAVEMHIALVDD